MTYDFRAIEARWQRHWDEHRTFRADIDPERPKYYVLDMFPYPSGDGLHVGHPEGYTATDIVARYKRMTGHNVLHPMGWDAFGLPAERYAMRTGTHPATRTAECIVNFKRQLKTLGFSYDWEREIDTTDPRYFKWTQWIFLQIWGSFYDPEAGRARPIAELAIPDEVRAAGDAAVRRYRDERRLAYLHEAPVNWCPELRVVLANEEVDEHVEQGYTVVRRSMKQWMMRITAYAERLIADLEGLEWPTSVLEMQRNWIGRSEGAEVRFQVIGGPGGELTVFTTRPDTLFGATYMVLAPEHPLVAAITTPEQREAVEAYVQRTALRSERDRQAEAAEGEKTGVFTGAYAKNPVNGQEIPVWISDYVLISYGTGAIMAVPGHDERDHAFARSFGLPIVEVVAGGDQSVLDAAFVGEGTAINSGPLDGLRTPEAKAKMLAWLEEHGLGRRRVSYKLRDWLFSRQRYWGEPFPLVHGEGGEVLAVPEAELPVTLPPMDDFQPSETGEPPLAKAEAWRRYDGPGGRGLRETNTMPQWAGSCWYYLRFMDPSNDAAPFSKAAADYWLPVDLYIGGAEHAVLHLLYARFWHKVLFDLGHVGTREPFQRLVNQGMVLGATYLPKDRRKGPEGAPLVLKPEDVVFLADQWQAKATGEPVDVQWDKMSKSRGNVVNPDDVIRQYGADTMRLYEMFMGPLEHSAPWQPEGVAGCYRFLQRAYRLAFESFEDGRPDVLRELPPGEGNDRQRRLLHRTIDAVSERIDRLAFNTAISAMMVFVRDIAREGEPLHRDALAQFVLLLSPFAPHLAEEIWAALGHPGSLAHEPWPAADDALLVDDTFPLVVQIGGKRRAELQVPVGVTEPDVIARVMQEPELARYLEGKTPRRVVYVPGKLVNIVL